MLQLNRELYCRHNVTRLNLQADATIITKFTIIYIYVIIIYNKCKEAVPYTHQFAVALAIVLRSR